jgi:hypothetical protein
MEILKAQLIFPSKPNFFNLFQFSVTRSIQNQYLLHLNFEICGINSIKSNSPRVFQQDQ